MGESDIKKEPIHPSGEDEAQTDHTFKQVRQQVPKAMFASTAPQDPTALGCWRQLKETLRGRYNPMKVIKTPFQQYTLESHHQNSHR